MPRLSTRLAAVVLSLFVPAAAQAITVNAFWSFDLNQNGTGGVNGNVTAENFPGTPTRSRTGSNTATTGGEASFTDFQGNTWLGSGNFNSPGNSLAWNAGSTGNSMTHVFSMDNLENLSIRMAIRSATSDATPQISQFSAIEYNTGSGFLTAAAGSALLIPVSGNNFVTYLLDLSSLSAIEDQANVQLRFSFANVPTNTSFRVDNIQFTANVIIPEPATLGLSGIALAGLALRRRRLA